MHYYCYYYLCICRIYYTMFYDSNALWWLDREWEARINYYVWSVWLTSARCAALNTFSMYAIGPIHRMEIDLLVRLFYIFRCVWVVPGYTVAVDRECREWSNYEVIDYNL